MFRRLLKSARAPAGKVKRKNGSEAAVAISESSIGEAPNAFINHVAAVSWAATQTPETTLGNHSPTKAGFLRGCLKSPDSVIFHRLCFPIPASKQLGRTLVRVP